MPAACQGVGGGGENIWPKGLFWCLGDQAQRVVVSTYVADRDQNVTKLDKE
jgi:hypothetical protein